MHDANDPGLRCFLPIAADSHFPMQNLPFGVFRQGDKPAHLGVAIGSWVLDLHVLSTAGLFDGAHLGDGACLRGATLNPLLTLGPTAWRAVRQRLSQLLRHDEPTLRDHAALRAQALLEQTAVSMQLPLEIGDYTDFYSSREHAINIGTMLRGADNALMPNWLHVPIAYHGRSSSIVLSGTPLHRPWGQIKPDQAEQPVFTPSKAVDFELELGYVVGPGNPLGQPIPVGRAHEHIFGVVLVNDWSARDIQKWEYQPLGPFLAKNFGTAISPWVVPLDALAPFRVPGPVQEPPPLPYLRTQGPQAYDIQLEVLLEPPHQAAPHCISRSNARHLYWSCAQQLAHHTSNGCNLRPGDLLATGTISGPTPDSYGSLMELAWKGTRPLVLPDGSQRTFVADGDKVIMTGWCQGAGYRIGLGEVWNCLLPALPASVFDV